MLVNTIFFLIFTRSCSKILKETLSLTVINDRYRCIMPIISNKVVTQNIWKMSMTNENYANSSSSNSNQLPSTSGYCGSNWNVFSNNEQSNIIPLNDCRRSRSVDSGEHQNHFCVVMNPFAIAQRGFPINYFQPYNVGCEFPMHLPVTNYKQQHLSRRYFYRPGTAKTFQNFRISGKDKDKQILLTRRWESVSGTKLEKSPGYIFTLLSYNVLAQDLLDQHPHLYQFHNQQSLQWTTRWNNLFEEMRRLYPDILCLQEVQESHITDYYSLFEALGYKRIYKKRTGIRTDGCALFYKPDHLNLVEYKAVEYFQPNVSILDRDNVGIVAKFAPKMHPTREFVVATTHLLYNPKRQDIRLAQMQLLLAEIERISYNGVRTSPSYLPVILTGDLNTSPDSPLYDFVIKGELNYENLPRRFSTDGKVLIPADLGITDNCQHVDLLQMRLNSKSTTKLEEQLSNIDIAATKNLDKKESLKSFQTSTLFGTGTLKHNFAFRSVYSHAVNGKIEGTTFQDKWLTVDYIFYSARKDETELADKIQLLSRYRLPTVGELKQVKIPNTVLGSDHLSLMAKFKLEF